MGVRVKVSYQLYLPSKTSKEGGQEASWPPQLAPLHAKELWLCSELPPDVCEIYIWDPAILWRKLILPAAIRGWSPPKAQGHRWGMECRSTGKSKTFTPYSLQRPSTMPHWQHTHSLSIVHFILPALVNKTLRYLDSFSWGSNSFPTQTKQSSLFKPVLTWWMNIDHKFHYSNNFPHPGFRLNLCCLSVC